MLELNLIAKKHYSNSKSERYLCWQRRRLDIVFDLEMVLHYKVKLIVSGLTM